ncbi:helix-turn-helix transcriptional regulator [bacterium]|nr:helix-turn-helix transcriptional regulator [bacterium]
MQTDLKNIEINKKILLKAIGKIIHQKRKDISKGINKFSFEYDIGNGLLSRLEKGRTDTQISTLWKLANAFGVRFSDLALEIEKELPEDFNFYE